MYIQAEGGGLNDIRSGDASTQTNTCCKCGEGEYFNWNCHKSVAQAQTADNVDTVIGKMTTL